MNDIEDCGDLLYLVARRAILLYRFYSEPTGECSDPVIEAAIRDAVNDYELGENVSFPVRDEDGIIDNDAIVAHGWKQFQKKHPDIDEALGYLSEDDMRILLIYLTQHLAYLAICKEEEQTP